MKLLEALVVALPSIIGSLTSYELWVKKKLRTKICPFLYKRALQRKVQIKFKPPSKTTERLFGIIFALTCYIITVILLLNMPY